MTQKKDFDIESNMIIWKCKHLGLSFNKKSKGSEKQLKGNISQTTSKKQCLQHMLSELWTSYINYVENFKHRNQFHLFSSSFQSIYLYKEVLLFDQFYDIQMHIFKIRLCLYGIYWMGSEVGEDNWPDCWLKTVNLFFQVVD